MANNKTGAPLNLELNTPGVPMSSLTTWNENLNTINNKTMAKVVFDPPAGGDVIGPVELAGGIAAYAPKKGPVRAKLLWSGSAAAGSTINVPDIMKYELLVVSVSSLGAPVFCRRSGSTVQGLGGGQTTTYARLATVSLDSISENGNCTILAANSFSIAYSNMAVGGLLASTVHAIYGITTEDV